MLFNWHHDTLRPMVMASFSLWGRIEGGAPFWGSTLVSKSNYLFHHFQKAVRVGPRPYRVRPSRREIKIGQLKSVPCDLTGILSDQWLCLLLSWWGGIKKAGSRKGIKESRKQIVLFSSCLMSMNAKWTLLWGRSCSGTVMHVPLTCSCSLRSSVQSLAYATCRDHT